MAKTLRIDVATAFPKTIECGIKESVPRIAREKGLLEVNAVDLRDYADNKFRHIDDAPYGGGAGMLIRCQPIFDCVEDLKSKIDYDEIIYVTADGEPYSQAEANKLSLATNLLIIAGHYKGVDQRVRDALVTKEYSIGDYVLSGGELPALVIIDSVARLIPGVLGDAESALEDSFMDGLLEPPQYTRPADFRGMKVPEVLRSGDPKKIKRWQLEKAIEKTKKIRPDLYRKYESGE